MQARAEAARRSSAPQPAGGRRLPRQLATVRRRNMPAGPGIARPGRHAVSTTGVGLRDPRLHQLPVGEAALRPMRRSRRISPLSNTGIVQLLELAFAPIIGGRPNISEGVRSNRDPYLIGQQRFVGCFANLADCLQARSRQHVPDAEEIERNRSACRPAILACGSIRLVRSFI